MHIPRDSSDADDAYNNVGNPKPAPSGRIYAILLGRINVSTGSDTRTLLRHNVGDFLEQFSPFFLAVSG